MGRGIPLAAMGRPLRRSGHAMRHNNPTGAKEAPAAPAPAPAPEAAPAPEPEAASFSMSNTKAELLAEADRLGLGMTSGNTKAEILAAIEAA